MMDVKMQTGGGEITLYIGGIVQTIVREWRREMKEDDGE